MAWTVKPSSTADFEKRDKPYLTPAMKKRFKSEILPRYEKQMGALMPILNEIQHKYRCITFQAMVEVAHYLEITPAERRYAVRGRSQISIEPQGRQRKSSDPQRRSWRAGMQGSEPVKWFSNLSERAAKASRFGVSNSRPP